MTLPVLSSMLLILAAALLLNLTPEIITDDVMKILSPERKLHDRIKAAQGRKKSRRLSGFLTGMQDALVTTGKEGWFATICALSLVLLVSGALLAVSIGNLLLIPVFAVSLSLIPFLYAKSSLSYYQKHLGEELETALSIVTTSYIRTDSILHAVSENIGYIKPPISEMFKSFQGEATAVNSNTKKALQNLKEKVDNQIYREWCDTLIACQDDRTLKDTLLPVVNKLTDVRIVNNELKTILYEPRKEYCMMAALVIGNIPLLYMLNKSWYDTLMTTPAGKIMLAVCGTVILVTAMLMVKYTKPVEYRR